MMLSPNRLGVLLKPQGFWLRHYDPFVKHIDFVRSAPIPRLYEHLCIRCGGKSGEAVYATTSISGSTSPGARGCSSEADRALNNVLQTDAEHGWALLSNQEESKAWEKRLAIRADAHCRATAQALGPALQHRLQPAFEVVDRYIVKAGNLFDILDSEYRHISVAPNEVQSEVDRLSAYILNVGTSMQDLELALTIIFSFAPEVEHQADAFRGSNWHQDSELQLRTHLLADFIREQRRLFALRKP